MSKENQAQQKRNAMKVNGSPAVSCSNPNELGVVATLLTEYPDAVPANCAKLLHYAADSFFDERLGTVAIAIRQVSQSASPVHPISVREWLTSNNKFDNAGGAIFFDALPSQALPISLAEFEAEKLWEQFRVRRQQSVYSDAAEQLQRHPEQADTIIRVAESSISDLNRQHGKIVHLTVRTPNELLAMKFDESNRLLGDRLLEKGGAMSIVGAGSMGKTRFFLQQTACIIAGIPFVGFETRGQGSRWLILQAENSNQRLQHDLSWLRQWLGEKAWGEVNNSMVIHTLETDSDCVLSLNLPETINRIEDLIGEHEPDGIGWDSIYNFGIGDLNKDEDMLNTLTTISRLSKRGNPNRAICVLHHALTGKAGAARATGYDRASFGRNSKVLHMWTRGQINVAPGSADSNDVLVLTCGKCSNGKEFAPFAVRLNPETMIYEVDGGFDLEAWEQDVTGKKGEPIMSVERVQELCTGALPKSELAKKIANDCGCSRATSYRWAEKAEKAGTIHWTKSTETYVANR